MDHIENLDTFIREGFNGIILCHKNGSLEILDTTDNTIFSKVQIWMSLQTNKGSRPAIFDKYIYPKLPNIGSDYATLSAKAYPFVFTDGISYSPQEDDIPNLGYLMLTSSLKKPYAGAPQYPEVIMHPMPGPLNQDTKIASLLSWFNVQFAELTGAERAEHKSWKRVFSKDLPNFTFHILLNNLVNAYRNVDFVNQETMGKVTDSFALGENLSEMETIVSKFQQWKWSSLNAWFCAVLHSPINKDEIEAVIVGSKSIEGVQVFSPTIVTKKGLNRIRYCTEILREAFRRIFKLKRATSPVHLNVFSAQGNNNCTRLRVLAMIWAHYYNIDTVEIARLGNNALRTLLYFSRPAEDALRSTLFKNLQEHQL